MSAPASARNQLNPPKTVGRGIGLLRLAFKRMLKSMVKSIAHGIALSHHPSPPETWGLDTAYVRLTVRDVVEQSATGEVKVKTRSKVVQKKTGTEVAFEISPETRLAVHAWITDSDKLDRDPLFTPIRGRTQRPLSTRQYERLVKDWVQLTGLNPAKYGTHSLRRTKVALIYKQTGNLRVAQLLLGHASIENTARYLGIEQDDALTISERVKL
jgi:integrase